MKKLISLLFLFNLISSFSFTPTAFANDMGQTKRQNTSVSALVGPQIRDFQFAMRYFSSSVVHQGTTINYDIIYGAKTSAAFTTANTIVVSYSTNEAPDNSPIVDYVTGSATEGYDGAVPVIDTINRTITWTIPALPAGVTDQIVSFKLGVNTHYIGTNRITFWNRADMSNTYVTMPEQIIHQDYLYDSSLILPGPTATPAPKAAPVPTATPTPAPSQITNVEFTGISSSGSTIEVQTASPSKLTVTYGTNKSNLSQSVSTNQFATDSRVSLTDLAPDTIYYFRIKTTDRSGRTYLSEIFTFRTAKQTFIQKLGNNVIVLTTNGNVLLSNLQKQVAGSPPMIILTENSPYKISYSLADQFSVKSIDIVVQNKVLGANTQSQTDTPSDYVLSMQEVEPSLYIANLQALSNGEYNVFLRVADGNGNIIQQKIAELKIVPHLTVYDQDSRAIIADARIFLSYYNEQTKSYAPVDQNLLAGFANPIFTDEQGQISINLTPGKYRAVVSSFLYDPKTVDFTLGSRHEQQFPDITLKKDPFNLASLITFIQNYSNDTAVKGINGVRALASSTRLFHLFAVSTTGSFVGLSYLLFSLRSSIAINSLPVYLAFSLSLLLNRHKQRYIFGRIKDEDHIPLSNVRIDAEDADTNTVMTHTSTNKLGNFYFNNKFANSVNLIISKEGFARTTIKLEKEMSTPDTGLRITLTKGIPHHKSAFSLFIAGVENILGMLFEVILVISLILEVGYLILYGFGGDAAFFILSLLNLCLWLFYLHQKSISRIT